VKKVSFVKVGESSEVPVGKMKIFKVGEKECLVANVKGNYYAIGNRCTHAKGDLSQGSLEGNIVTCPKHKSKFDVTTGKVVSGPKMPLIHPKINDEPSYEVKVEGNAILLRIE
jgi:nitrite reductase/ring-hydroxylating ferredoxin subunit